MIKLGIMELNWTKEYTKNRRFKNKNSQIPIAIDIGVNEETIQLLVKAGATKLVSGSTILNSDNIKEKIDELKNLSLV